MHTDPVWSDIALRLLLAALAGAAFGMNREAKGHAAGLRTTLLVCLAAALAMLLADVLMTTTRRPDHGVISMDVMRLPLGILTGVGFIGGGAILRQGGTVTGVTTAATNRWFLAAALIMVGPPMSMFSTASASVTLSVATARSNGYRFTHTRSIGSIPSASSAAACSGLSRTASKAA